MRKLSQTYYNLVDMLFKLGNKSIISPVYNNSFSGNRFELVNSGTKTHRIYEPICIANTKLWELCTPAEWHLVGRITTELKDCCVLWECNKELKKNGNVVKAIKGLIYKEILIKTETTDIYVVNPTHLRRGDPFNALSTTADTLKDEVKVGREHIRNRKPVKEFNRQEGSYVLLNNAGYNISDIK